MNLSVSNFKISLAALFAGAVISTDSFAQTVSTPIVGFQTKTINTGRNGISFPLLNPDLAKASVSGTSGSSIILSGVSNVGSLLTSGEPYYIEVYSGPLKGDRFDVNTASTISAANSSVVLDTSSGNNTYPVASIGSALDSANVALRKHITLTQIQSFSSAPLTGNNNPASADQIQVFEGSSLSTYFLRGDNVTWRKSGSSTDFSKLPVPPGSGVVIIKLGSPIVLTQSGAVRQNDFATPYKAGLQLQGPSVPVDRSASDIGLAPGTNGWVGNNNPSLADQIQIFENGSFTTYSLRSDGQLRKSGTTSNFINTSLLGGSDIWLIKRQNANQDLVETQVVQ